MRQNVSGHLIKTITIGITRTGIPVITDDKNQQFYFDENHRRWLYDAAKHRWYWDDTHYIVDTAWDGSNQGGTGWATTTIVRDTKKKENFGIRFQNSGRDNHPDLNNGWGNND